MKKDKQVKEVVHEIVKDRIRINEDSKEELLELLDELDRIGVRSRSDLENKIARK